MQGPESTRAVLAEIQGRNARMTIQTGQNAAPEAVTRPVQGGLLGRMIEAVNNPRWTANLQTLRDMRSEFRRLASGMADTEKNTLKLSDLDRIQGAITDDMISLLSRNAAAYREAGDIQTAQGFERSIREFQRADRFTRLSMQRMETVEKLFRADSVESLARNITNASMSGSKGNLDLLRTLQRTLQPDEMAEVGSALLSELGRPVASAGGTAQELGFSVNSFMTRWNQMSPQARHILFGGEHSAALDDVVRVVRRLSEVEKYANASNSGRMTMNVGGILAGLSSIATGTGGYALGAAGGGFGLSFLLSRPTTARWLVGYLRLKADPHTTARRLNAYVGQLGQYTQHEPALLPFQRALAEQFGVVEGDAEEQRDQKDVRVPNARQRPEDDLVPFGHGGVITTSPNAMRNFRDAREGNSMRGWR
jgi:hypothetical protein